MPPSSRSSVAGLTLEALAALDTYKARGGDTELPGVADVIVALAEHAPALLMYAFADPSLIPDVLARPLVRGDSEASYLAKFVEQAGTLGDGPELMRSLRRLRHRAVIRIALREVHRLADVDGTAAEMAALASAICDVAYRASRTTFEGRHGPIVDLSGNAIPFVVLGMGKLGGAELNLGSDIDLVLLYGTDEGHVGETTLSVHESFTRIAQRFTKLIAEQTEDGFCFRVDHRLRPEGSHGALVNSLASAERYYEVFGRPWERAAMLRARPVAGERELGDAFLVELRPFIYPRTPDPRIALELRSMVERSRRALSGDGTRDVKLGRGGIRESEFFVQSLQLIWGGQHRGLQTPSTTRALRALRTAGLLGHREAMQLGADWALLRRIEHRIHVWTGYQTHALPRAASDLEGFARSLGFEGAAEFEEVLDAARARVSSLFDSLVDGHIESRSDPEIDELIDSVRSGESRDVISRSVALALPVDDPDEATSHLMRLARTPHSPLGTVGATRNPDLARTLLMEVRVAAYPDAALRHLAEFFARLGKSFSYDRALAEQPLLARQLVSLFGASSTLSVALIAHPDTVDFVFTGHALLPSEDAIRAAHAGALFVDFHTEHPETFERALRRQFVELWIRIGLAYVGGGADLPEVSSRLSTLAECQIRLAVDFALAETTLRLGAPEAHDTSEPDGLCVVALGKLGSRELGFASDLDLGFYFGAEGTIVMSGAAGRIVTLSEFYARVGQRVLRLLSLPNEEGRGYDVDMRLRPSGSRGLLSQSVAAFDAYYSTQAASWERQALTRARPIAGSPQMAERMQARIDAVAFERAAPLASEVAAMRRRLELELAGEKPTRFHVKYGYGGIVDVEFIVQWLAMVHGADREVRVRGTANALRALAKISALTNDQAEALLDAWNLAREIEQASKLLDEHREPVLVPDGPVAERIARRLQMRTRDGVEPSAVLIDTWLRTAFEVRAMFTSLIADVGTLPPWER